MGGSVEKAEKLLKELEDKGLEADVVTYNSLINACAKKGSVEKAEKLLKELEDKGLKANVVTYTSLINACAKAGNVEKAEKFFEELEDKGFKPNLKTYQAGLHAYAAYLNQNWRSNTSGPELMLKHMVQNRVIADRPFFCVLRKVVKSPDYQRWRQLLNPQ